MITPQKPQPAVLCLPAQIPACRFYAFSHAVINQECIQYIMLETVGKPEVFVSDESLMSGNTFFAPLLFFATFW